MWGDDDVSRLRGMTNVRALVIGREVCPTTGKVHYQGYVRFSTAVRFSWWKNQFPTAHVEARKGTEAEAAAYCRKDRQLVADFGCEAKRPMKGGSAEDQFLDLLEAGAPDWQLWKYHRKLCWRNWHHIDATRQRLEAEKEKGHDFTYEGARSFGQTLPDPPLETAMTDDRRASRDTREGWWKLSQCGVTMPDDLDRLPASESQEDA